MRILFVIDHYAPILGGAERQTELLAQLFAQRGHEVAVATTWQPDLKDYEERNGVRLFRVKGWTTVVPFFFKDPAWRRYPPPFPDPGLVWALRRVVQKVKPQVVIVYGWIAYSCAAALLGTKLPLVVSSRDYGYSCATRLMMYKGHLCEGPALNKCLKCSSDYYGFPKGVATVMNLSVWRGLLLHKAWALHNVSGYVRQIVSRDLLRERNERMNRRKHILNIVIHSIFSENLNTEPDPTILVQLPSEPFILFVGTLAHHKGVDILLDAYQKLASPPPLVLIGIIAPDTPKSFPPGVTVLREVPHATVMAAWERCLYGVVPSMCPDSLPNVVLEGMSKGKALIGSNAGGIPDMIMHEETGLLVPMGDSDALAKAMQRLYQDEALRKRLGTAGRDLTQQFESGNIVPCFEALADQLITYAGR